MKKLCTAILLFLTFQVFAQSYPITNINITLPTNPDANTANWGTGTAIFSINASANATGGRVDAGVMESKILVIIKKSGTKICGAFTASNAPSSHFSSLIKTWSGQDAYSFLGQSCVLTPGDYELCVQFFGYSLAAPKPLSEEKCKSFTIRGNSQQNYQAPQPLLPVDGTSYNETDIKKPIIFRWTPIVPKPVEHFTYKFSIWQLMQGQTAAQAFRTNKPIFEKDSLEELQTIVPNLINGPCAPPYICEFVWTVSAVSKEGKILGNETGYTNLKSFSFNQNKKRKSPIPGDSSNSLVSIDTFKAVAGDTIRAGLNGEFKVVVLTLVAEANKTLTGTGKAFIPWLGTSIAVSFSKIRIDSTKRLKEGGILSVKSNSTSSSFWAYPIAWGLSNQSGPIAVNIEKQVVNWTNNKLDNLVTWVNDIAPGKQPLIKYKSNIPPPPIPDNSLKMPFGLQFNKASDLLVITEMLFEPNQSEINFVVQKTFTKGVTDHKLGFAGKEFKIHTNSIEFANGRIELVEDIAVPNLISNPTMTYIFKKGENTSGCFISWDSTGIKDLGLGIDIKFTRNWLLPVPKSADSVKASLSGYGSGFNDIILRGSLGNCEIVGTHGVKMQIDSLALDLSELRSPTGMHYPKNYLDDTSAQARLLWQGLYIKKFGISLPDTWKNAANPTQILAENCIIDDNGLTMKLQVNNIISFPNGRVVDMSASLDSLNLSIFKNSITEGSVKGKLVLPISRDTISNALKYAANFAQIGTNASFQIVVSPIGPIDADILKGKMEISPTSNITATLTDTIKSFSIHLNGKFKWDNPLFNIPPNQDSIVVGNTGSITMRTKGIKGLKMEMNFESLGLEYQSNRITDSSTLDFNPGTWSFASPQKTVANFPVTIKKVYYKSLTKGSSSNPNWKELMRGALMIDLVACLTDDIGGKTTIGVAFAIDNKKNAFWKLSPAYKGIFIDDIEVHADMPAVKIDGKLKMYDNDLKYGDGFIANLGVTFTAVSIQANALVQFGNTSWQNNNQNYRYWRAQADVKFEPGIPFLTGVGFYGFGGGAFYNMKANPVQKTAPEVGFKYEFEPQKSSLGFVADVTIATLPKFETFNSDLSLLAQFNANTGGLTRIGFTGDFWLASKLEERINAKIKGGLIVDYVFADKIFYSAAQLSVNVPPAIKTVSPIGFVMNINGTTNKWYFKCGTPNNTNSIQIFGIDLYSYLMFGNDIPEPNGFTPRFVSHYLTATGKTPNNSNVGAGGVGTNTATGKGIAMGVGIELSKQMSKDLYSGTCRDWKIGGNLLAGAELNLALMHQTGCIGINGYRASGNIGLYGTIDATITGTSFSKVCDTKSIDLFKIKTGAWVEGKFPNPEYATGAVTADIDLFSGLCKIQYNQSFELGTNCNGTEDVIVNAAQEDQANDYRNKLIQSVSPVSHYNFPVSSPINVNYALAPQRVFDVAENQGDGSTKNRTFKLQVTETLEIKGADNNWTTIATVFRVNNLGEYQYVKKTDLSDLQHNTAISAASSSFSTNSGLSLMNSAGSLQTANLNATITAPANPAYPNPIPDLVNHLTLNKDYRFKVTASLMEYSRNPIVQTGTVVAGQGRGNGDGMELSWAVAKTRSGIPITETKTVLFRTGPMELFAANASQITGVKK